VSPSLDLVGLSLLRVLVFVVTAHQVATRHNLETSEDHRVTSMCGCQATTRETKAQGTGKANFSTVESFGVEERRTEAIMNIVLLSLSGHTVRDKLLGRHSRAWWLCAQLSLA
jgi:hypothetical protein